VDHHLEAHSHGEHEDTEPPFVEWDAPVPDWERPAPVWGADGGTAPTVAPRRTNTVLLGLMLVLTLVAVIAAALHYQLLDGIVERFGLGGEASSEAGDLVPAPPPARRPAPKMELAPEPAPAPSPVLVPEPAETAEPTEPVVSSPDTVSGTEDLVRADEIRRRGIRAASAGDYEAAVELFKRSRELGGDPADLDRLIDECRRKLAKQYE